MTPPPPDVMALPVAQEERPYPYAPLTMLQLHAHSARLTRQTPYVRRDNATLVPPPLTGQDRARAIVQGGVCDDAGNFDPIAHHYMSLWPWVESSGHWQGAAAHLPSRVLYGGVAREHFGHFITESLGRIWYALARPDDSLDHICFLRSPAGSASQHGLQLLSLFDDLPSARIVDEPLQVREVVIPVQAAASEEGLLCLPDYAVLLRQSLAPRIQPERTRSVYVSRSRYTAPHGQPFSGSIVREELLEQQLAACGYDIYHPQEHDVAHQVQTYRSAANIIVNEGSAMHLVALSAAPETRIAILGRRLGLLPLFEDYLYAFLGFPALPRTLRSGFELTIGDWGERWLVIDYPELSAQLSQRGMLPQGTIWPEIHSDLREITDRAAQFGPHTVIARMR